MAHPMSQPSSLTAAFRSGGTTARRVAVALLVVVAITGSAGACRAGSQPARESWQVLDQTPWLGDTVFVRALCRFQGPSESTFVRSRIENTAGHVWFADTLLSDSETLEGVDECDLSAWIAERRDSLVVSLQAVYSPCYDDCGQFRY